MDSKLCINETDYNILDFLSFSEEVFMSRICQVCEKKPRTGNLVSHSNIKTRTRWLPNLKKMKTWANGTTCTIRVCTRCIRSGAITRPPKRIPYQPNKPQLPMT